jgi:hypothetical protein
MLPEWLTKAPIDGSPLSVEEVVKRLGMSFAFGCLAVITYRFSVGATRGRGDSIPATLVLLSVLIALVTAVINDNVARAFSLVGALAIVRFRTVVEDTRDTAFVIYAVVVGMAAGLGFFVAPLLATPLIAFGAWAFSPRQAPLRKHGLLILRLAAVRPPEEAIAEVLQRLLGGGRVVALATARGGSAFDVTYEVIPPPSNKAIEILTELSRIEGVQGVELKER